MLFCNSCNAKVPKLGLRTQSCQMAHCRAQHQAQKLFLSTMKHGNGIGPLPGGFLPKARRPHVASSRAFALTQLPCQHRHSFHKMRLVQKFDRWELLNDLARNVGEIAPPS